MKTKILLTITLFLFSFAVWAQNDVFEKLSNNKDISVVYISKSLLGMMSKSDMKVDGADIKSLAGKLEKMEIYNAESKSGSNLIKAEVDKLKDKKYETLMRIKDENENITFYAYKEKDKFKDLIMYINTPDECTLIRIAGNFTTEDIQDVVNGSKKK